MAPFCKLIYGTTLVGYLLSSFRFRLHAAGIVNLGPAKFS